MAVCIFPGYFRVAARRRGHAGAGGIDFNIPAFYIRKGLEMPWLGGLFGLPDHVSNEAGMGSAANIAALSRS
ncbi:MAG TPA: hypothetical protein PLP32_18700 [Accumulibacter sp.]|nr:hypothetical protein [Accumulibacter sp.]